MDFLTLTIKLVEELLQKHFGKSYKDESIHVLDTFTGITRLLQSGLIPKEDLLRKYTQELHANEIMLLSYYIANINIEETFHAIYKNEYIPFEGIVLTDTFESTEKEDSFEDKLFNENNTRLEKQFKESIFVMLGNPPYSAKQQSDNTNYASSSYPKLDKSIEENYSAFTAVQNKQSLYDSYIGLLSGLLIDLKKRE